MSNRKEQESPAAVTWLYLPIEECQIERAMLRAGIDRYDDVRLQYERSNLPPALDLLLVSFEENLRDLNEICISFKELDDWGREKIPAVMRMADPSNDSQVRNLMTQLDLFDFIPGISTPEEYGRHMIIESGHYEYDSELEEFYNFKKYGEQRIAKEYGMFTSLGYVSFHGSISIEEVMAGSSSGRINMTIGGM